MNPLATAAATTAFLTAGTLAYAALSPTSQLFGPVLVVPPKPDQVALTYDDGPNPAATPALLDVLARHDVRATFFLIGQFARAEPALTRSIAAAGHLIGNHSLTHPCLAWQSRARIREELATTSAILEDILGAPVRFFRPPHGARRPYVLEFAESFGLTTVQWNLITGDWNPLAPETILGRLERGIAHNRRRNRASNICLHDGGHLALNQPRLPSVQATDRLLTKLRPTPTVFITPEDWA